MKLGSVYFHEGQTNVYERWHWVRIEMKNEVFDTIKVLVWRKLLWDTRVKFDWYFRYRAALMQVQNPRFHINHTWGNDPITDQDILLKNWENKLRAKKAKVTEIKNKMNQARNSWNQIFPIENESDWIRAKNKLARVEAELIELINHKPTIK